MFILLITEGKQRKVIWFLACNYCTRTDQTYSPPVQTKLHLHPSDFPNSYKIFKSQTMLLHTQNIKNMNRCPSRTGCICARCLISWSAYRSHKTCSTLRSVRETELLQWSCIYSVSAWQVNNLNGFISYALRSMSKWQVLNQGSSLHCTLFIPPECNPDASTVACSVGWRVEVITGRIYRDANDA